MFVIDSSVWVSLFLEYDSKHADAEEIFEMLEWTIFVPYCVVSEVCSVLTYKHSKEQSDKFLEYLENNSDIILVNNDYRDDIATYRSTDKKISFADMSIIGLAIDRNLTLVTFDEQMASIYRNQRS